MNVSTHWEDCWRDPKHHSCALTHITTLEAQRDEATQTKRAISTVLDIEMGHVAQLLGDLAQARREAANWKLAYGHTLGIPEAAKEVERLRREAEAAQADLADALDLKNGVGPTEDELAQARREIWAWRDAAAMYDTDPVRAFAAVEQDKETLRRELSDLDDVVDERDRLAEALRRLHHTENGTCAFNLRSGCHYCALLTPAPPASDQPNAGGIEPTDTWRPAKETKND